MRRVVKAEGGAIPAVHTSTQRYDARHAGRTPPAEGGGF